MKVSNYAELIAEVTGGKFVAFVCFGSYQGEYIAVIEKGDDIELYKNWYGSCSGCDWFEAESHYDYEAKETVISDAKAKEYFETEIKHPFATIPKETVLRVEEETFISFLPRNIRDNTYDFDGHELYIEIIKGLIKNKNETSN